MKYVFILCCELMVLHIHRLVIVHIPMLLLGVNSHFHVIEIVLDM